MENTRWTKEQCKSFTEDFLNLMSLDDLAQKYSRTKLAISGKAFGLNLKRDLDRVIYPLDDLYVAKEYLEGKTIDQLAEKYGCSTGPIRHALIRANCEKRDSSNRNRKYTINETFFDTIDTPNKAYFLGFLYADGCNSKNGNTITLPLSVPDEEILLKLNKIINSTRPLQFKPISRKNPNHTDQYCLAISNKHISKQLNRLGVVSNKSLILKFPTEKQVPNHLIHHFIRGYFDGDGHVGISGNSYHISFVGTFDMMQGIQKHVISGCGFNEVTIRRDHAERTTNTFSFKYGGNIQCTIFKEWLYKDAELFMKRKRDKFDLIEIKRPKKNSDLIKNNTLIYEPV